MLIDILIVLLAGAAVYRSWGSGFVRQFLASGGFFGGIFLGRWLESYTISLVHTAASRTIMTLATVLGVALVGLVIGESIGINLKYRLEVKSSINSIMVPVHYCRLFQSW